MKKVLFAFALLSVAFISAETQQTLVIIKPDAVKAKHVGNIISRYENSDLKIDKIEMMQFTPEVAKEFYVEHKDRPFYNDLVGAMSASPVVVLVVEGENAIVKNRQMIGATDPAEAEKGTLRAQFGASKQANAVHGSDSPAAATREIKLLFKK